MAIDETHHVRLVTRYQGDEKWIGKILKPAPFVVIGLTHQIVIDYVSVDMSAMNIIHMMMENVMSVIVKNL